MCLYNAQERLYQLLEAADGEDELQLELFEGAQRLVDADGMGGLYKAFALSCPSPSASSTDPPMGFSDVTHT